MKRIQEHGPCFVCGTANPQSIGIVWYIDDERVIRGEVTLQLAQQGPPSLAHGGASAALLDEAMGLAVWSAGFRAAAVNLNVDFRQPVPLNTPIHVTGRLGQHEGRTIHALGEICLPDGSIAVRSTGIYVEASHLFTLWEDSKSETSKVADNKE